MFKPAKIKFAVSALIVALWCICAPQSLAQCTYGTVTATITDPNGLPYSNGTVTASLQPATQQPLCGGVAVGGFASATLDVNGSFSMSLAANAAIVPAGTHWVFTVNGSGNVPPPIGLGGQSFTSGNITITSGANNLTSTLSNLAPALTRLIGSGGGGAGNPASPAGSVQLANALVNGFASTTGVNGAVFGISTLGSSNILTVPFSAEFCGPSPWYSALCFGAHARAGAQSTTATAAASTTVTLASAIDFLNFEWIDILTGGATPSGISAPVAPTILSPAVTGSTTYHAQCVAVDAHNGLVAGAVGSISTAPASFATSNLTNTNVTRSTAGVITVTVDNPYNANGAGEPTLVTQQGVTPGDMNGTYAMTSTDGTNWTAQTGTLEAATETATVFGTSTVWGYLDVTCPNPAGTSIVQYAVYTDTQGSMVYVSSTMPGLIGGTSAATIRDYGPVIMAGSSTKPPYGIPSAAPTAGSITNEEYTGQIVSGAGSTTLTVTPALTNAVSGAGAIHEDGPAIQAAMNAAVANGGGAAFIPPNQQYGVLNAFYSINAPITLPGSVDIYQGGSVSVNDTITFGSFSHVYAAPSPSQTRTSQFALQAYPYFGTTASPGLYFPHKGVGMVGVEVDVFANASIGALFGDSEITLTNDNFVVENNLSSAIPLVLQGPMTGVRMTNLNFTMSGVISPQGPPLPALWIKGNGNGTCGTGNTLCGVANDLVMDGINTFSFRGILFDGTTEIGSDQHNYRFYIQEYQAPSNPLLMFWGNLGSDNVHLEDAIMDSEPLQGIGNWSTNLQNVYIENTNTTTQVGACAVTGNPIKGLNFNTPFCIGQNFQARGTLNGFFKVAASTTSRSAGQVHYTLGEPDIYSSLTVSPIAWAYPTTNVSVTTTTGSIAAGTHTISMAIRGLGPNAGDSALSNVASFTLGAPGGVSISCSNCSSLPPNGGFDFFIDNLGQVGNPFASSTQTFSTKGFQEPQPVLDGDGFPKITAAGMYTPAVASQKINQVAANTYAGTATLVGGTITVTFPTAYNSAPVCVANDQTTAAALKVTTLAASVTIATSGSTTDSVFYSCTGNPN